MSRSVIHPLSAAATAPEALSLLHQRLLVAEEHAGALVRDMGSLGVCRGQILEPVERDPIQRPLSPLRMRHHALGEAVGEGVLWRQCDALVSRVCHLESLLQTLKLTTFRLETERELDPSHSARLKEQLAALQQEKEEEQRASRREVMRLRDQVRQACLDREEARGEVQRLGEALEVATTSKMDMALAAEELKMIKVQMSERLMELKEQMSLETARSSEAARSHGELLQRVEEMEGVVEMERRQAQIVQLHCHTLRLDGEVARQRLQEEEEQRHRLQGQCLQLNEQAEAKDSLVCELRSELKSAQLALRKQQQENNKLVRDSGDLRTATDKVQVLNGQLEGQCSELSAALRSLTVESAKLQTEHQASIKTERSRVFKQLQEQDLLLEAARRNIQTELQGALVDKVKLQRELETLKADHAQLLKSSTVAKETAVTQCELLECTVERLRGELSTVVTEGATTRKDRDSAKAEMCIVVTKLKSERSALERQLTQAKLGAGSLSATLQKQGEENRSLMGRLAATEHQQHAQQQVEQILKELTDSNSKLAYEKGKLQTRTNQLQEELRALKDAHAEGSRQRKLSSAQDKYTQGGGGSVAQTLENVLASHSLLQQNTESLQEELGGREQELVMLRRDRLQGQREIQRLQAEVEKLQHIMKTADSKKNRVHEPLLKALDVARLDNRKLAQSLEQAVLANSTLQGNLERARDQYQNTISQRDVELREAKADVTCLIERMETLELQMRKERDSGNRASQREMSELRKALEDSSAKSGDLSRANRELRGKVSELKRTVSILKASVKDQKIQLKQHMDNRVALNNSHKLKDMEAELKGLETLKEEYQKKNYEQGQMIQQFRSDTLSLQRELQHLSCSREGDLDAERELRHVMQDKCRRLEESIQKLQEAKDEAEQKLQDVSLESQQICENLEEAHNWFRSQFDNLKSGVEQNRCLGDEPQEDEHQATGSSTGGTHNNKKAPQDSRPTGPEWERWTSTMQRWETKRELARIAGGHRPGWTPTHTPTH